MKKIIFIITLLALCQQAFALDTATVEVKVLINQPPGIEGLLPNDGTTITEGDTLTISVKAKDPNPNDTLQYRYYINNIEKESWTTASSFNYTLTAQDTGLNRIKAEVTDGQKTVMTQEVEIFVFHKSPTLP